MQRSFASFRACAIAMMTMLTTAGAQCQPLTYFGFHQESVGWALAADGDEALFGHGNGWYCGLFARRGDGWWWRTALLGGSGAGSGAVAMGNAVALRGDVALLGDYRDVSTATAGAAVVFERSNGNWVFVADFYSPIAGTRFGGAVTISPDQSRLAIGSPVDGGSGRVYIYVRQPAGWVIEQVIDGAPLATTSTIGWRITLADSQLFVGADNGAGGSVIVFDRQGSTWTQGLTLAPAGLIATAGFGGAMSTDGTQLAIAAAQQTDGMTPATGRVFVYDLNQPGWNTQPTTVYPSYPAMSGFGRSLHINGQRMAIGSVDQASEYRRASSGSNWTALAHVWPPANGSFSLAFGTSVALFSRGILVGDHYHDNDPWQYPNNPGGVHSFDFTDLGEPLRACYSGVGLETGGTVPMHIDWPAQAGKAYQVFGSISGFGPTSIGGIHVPLTVDPYTWLLVDNPGLFVGGDGQIDASGNATLSLVVPAGLPFSLDGLELHHAVIAYDATSLAASNPVTTLLFKIY